MPARLSVQVHPRCTWPRPQWRAEDRDVVLCRRPARRDDLCGLKHGVTRDRFETLLREGHVAEALHVVPVSTGDSIFIPADASMPSARAMSSSRCSRTATRPTASLTGTASASTARRASCTSRSRWSRRILPISTRRAARRAGNRGRVPVLQGGESEPGGRHSPPSKTIASPFTPCSRAR